MVFRRSVVDNAVGATPVNPALHQVYFIYLAM